MKILVTGGAGFIGSHVVEYFQDKAKIRVLDNLRTGYRYNLDGLQCEFIEGSVLDKEIINEAMQGVDYVFHLAAMISVPESILNPQECIAINVNGTLNILTAAINHGVKKVILASSAAVYGDNPTVPKIETMFPEPRSPYAITKLDGEYYLKMFSVEKQLATTSLRFFNVFGPRQVANGTYASVIPIFAELALKNKPIVIFGNGEQTRDFIYVKDVVSGMAFAMRTPTMDGVYNIGYGKKMTINDLAQRIITEVGSKSKIEYHPARIGDIKHSMASVDKIRATGFKPIDTFEQGLKTTLEFFRKNIDKNQENNAVT